MSNPTLPASDPVYPGSRICTPSIEPGTDFELPRYDDDRWSLRLSAADHAKLGRGGPWSAIVTDLPSGRRFEIEGADCGAGPHCFCAARIVRAMEEEQPRKLFACPRCQRTAHLYVIVTAEARLWEDDESNLQTEVEGDHDWDDHAPMRCGCCEFSGEAFDFRTAP